MSGGKLTAKERSEIRRKLALGIVTTDTFRAFDELEAQAKAAEKRLRVLDGCPACNEDHPPESTCPPHEGRSHDLQPIQWRAQYHGVVDQLRAAEEKMQTSERNLDNQQKTSHRLNAMLKERGRENRALEADNNLLLSQFCSDCLPEPQTGSLVAEKGCVCKTIGSLQMDCIVADAELAELREAAIEVTESTRRCKICLHIWHYPNDPFHKKGCILFHLPNKRGKEILAELERRDKGWKDANFQLCEVVAERDQLRDTVRRPQDYYESALRTERDRYREALEKIVAKYDCQIVGIEAEKYLAVAEEDAKAALAPAPKMPKPPGYEILSQSEVDTLLKAGPPDENPASEKDEPKRTCLKHPQIVLQERSVLGVKQAIPWFCPICGTVNKHSVIMEPTP